MLADLERVEVLNAYQYDQTNFFSIQRIRFRPNRIDLVDKILIEKLKAEYYEILSQQKDEILCIMKQSRETGFFPMFGQGPWAILFPISVGENEIHLNLLAEEQYLQRLYVLLEKFTDAYKVVGNSNVKDAEAIDQNGQFRLASPSFTTKQRDIASYAAQHGYFESPKKFTAEELAEHFKISTSAVNMHLKNAENIAMKYFFGGISEEKGNVDLIKEGHSNEH